MKIYTISIILQHLRSKKLHFKDIRKLEGAICAPKKINFWKFCMRNFKILNFEIKGFQMLDIHFGDGKIKEFEKKKTN